MIGNSSNIYHNDVFYDIKNVKMEEVFEWALSKFDYKMSIEKLEGFFREKENDITYKEFMNLRKSAVFMYEVIIHRKGYGSMKEGGRAERIPPPCLPIRRKGYGSMKEDRYRWCIEIGSSITVQDKNGHKDLFLFIYLPESYLGELISIFDLSAINS
jgi:hypothetical protein